MTRPLLVLGLAVFALGRVPAAQAQRASDPPMPPETALVRALTRMQAGDPAGALAVLRPVLDAVPADGAAPGGPPDAARAALLGVLADATLALGDRTSARLHARAALDAMPADAAAAVRLARLDAAAGDARAATATLDAAMARGGDPAGVHLAASAALDLALDAADAVRVQSLATRIAAGGGLVPLLLDAAQRARLLPLLAAGSDAAVADAAFAAALRADPLDAATWAARAAHDTATGRIDRAMRARRVAARLDPSRYGALAPSPGTPSPGGTVASPTPAAVSPAPSAPTAGSAAEARAAYTAGRVDEAAPALAAAVEVDPTDPVAWRFAAMVRLELGDGPGAAALLDDARLIFPGDAALHIVAAYAALAARNAAAARDALAAADAALAESAPADAAVLRRALAAVQAAAEGRTATPDAALTAAALGPLPGGRLDASLRR